MNKFGLNCTQHEVSVLCFYIQRYNSHISAHFHVTMPASDVSISIRLYNVFLKTGTQHIQSTVHKSSIIIFNRLHSRDNILQSLQFNTEMEGGQEFYGTTCQIGEVLTRFMVNSSVITGPICMKQTLEQSLMSPLFEQIKKETFSSRQYKNLAVLFNNTLKATRLLWQICEPSL